MDASEPAFRPFPGNLQISNLPLETPLENDEHISTVATYKSSIYIGTSKGQILHLHLFEDASDYMLILQLQVTEKNVPVTKILPMPDVEWCLVICNRTLYVYTLPELLPCHVGKLRDVNDVLELSQVKNPKTKNIHDKAIVFTSTKLRVVQFIPPETIKLLRDIPYNGALIGVSSAAGTLANYSNICLVANGENYDVVDMQQTRRISLFEHNPEKAPGVLPSILPFKAEGKEEFVLPVRTNESTSMAMFINSFGDVTRGTLTWIDKGYPTNGMAVVWPYICGLSALGDSLRLTFSSLESLEVVESVDLKESFSHLELGEPRNLRIKDIQHPILYRHEGLLTLLRKVDIDGSGEPYTSLQPAHVTLYNESSLYYLYQESLTYLKLAKFETGLDTEGFDWKELLEELKDEAGVLRLLRIILLLVTKDLEKFTAEVRVDFDPRIFLYLTEKLDKEVYDGFLLESIVWKALVHFRKVELEAGFVSSFLQSAYKNSHSDSAMFDVLRLLIYSRAEDLKLVFDLIDRERELWQSEHRSNKKVLEQLQAKDRPLAEIRILLLQQEAEKDAKKTDEMAHLIAHLAFKLLDGGSGLTVSEKGIVEQDGVTVDLVEIIVAQLKSKIENSDLYNRTLLELLKLYPQKGLTFLEENKNGKHRATHRHILEEFSKLHEVGSSFSSLKLEFIEQSLTDSIKDKKEIDIEIVRELLNEQIEYLTKQKEDMASEYSALDDILASFKREHDLAKRHMSSIKWIDYLHVHSADGECKTLASLYLKLYEVLLALQLHNVELPLVEIGNSNAMKYLQTMFSKAPAKELIEECLSFGDHLNAHWFAVHEQPPMPKKLAYFIGVDQNLQEKYTKRPTDEVKNSIKLILNRYLQHEDALTRYEGVKHIVLQFGKGYFNPPEVLRLLPLDIPIAFVYGYLSDVLVDEDIKTIESDMTKILTRLDMKLTKNVNKEFHAAFAKYLEDDVTST